MANVTYYVMLPFVRETDTRELIDEQGEEALSELSAMSRARAMVGRMAGAVAFRRSGEMDSVVLTTQLSSGAMVRRPTTSRVRTP